MKTVVREIFSKGPSSVVEAVDSDGVPHRFVVPSTLVVKEANGELTVEDIEEGQPYGVAWENLIHTRLGPKGIADLLRKNGVWTLEDYFNNTRDVSSTFNEACTVNLQQFKEAVLNYRDHKEED